MGDSIEGGRDECSSDVGIFPGGGLGVGGVGR